MENGLVTLGVGMEDGTTDFEGLLVEPQDGHVSMDSVICFNEKILVNTMDMIKVSCSSGGSENDFAPEWKSILSGEVLDGVSRKDEAGYLQSQFFCTMGEEYLQGVEFAESITSSDYGSSEHLQISVSDSLILASNVCTNSPWKSDLYRIMELPGCQNDLNIGRSELNNLPSCHECNTLAKEKLFKSPTSCKVLDIDKLRDISSHSFQEVPSDDNNRSLSRSFEMLFSPKIEKNDESELTCKDDETNSFHGQEALATTLDLGNQSDAYPKQKRSRKPTQRYLDELEDPKSRYSKKRRALSSSNLKDKYLGVKDHKNCNMGSRAVRLPTEETSVKAIQVPFGSLVHKKRPRSQTYNMVHCAENGNLKAKVKDSWATLENQKIIEQCEAPLHLKRRDDGVCVSHLKKRNCRLKAASKKNRDGCTFSVSSNKRDDRVTAVSQKKRDTSFVVARHNKKNGLLSAKSAKEVCGRRKHHIRWTIAEVRTLIDGVSQYGVGRWSGIKKLFFSTSAHRTSVDLKDKWRNLLKVSGILERSNQKGNKKSNPAWRRLPKSILCRVCELATMYPYPRGRTPKIAS